ncbi:MAG: hypothetical protein ABIO39_02735 [Caulobacteraceae bacterium]
MGILDHYLAMAIEMRRRSAVAADAELREDYLKLADDWESLAGRIDPNWRTRTTYEISLLDEDGALLRKETIEAGDDDAAIDFAGAWSHAFGIEVWRGTRLVARFPSQIAAVPDLLNPPRAAGARR